MSELLYEELRKLYFLPSIITMKIKEVEMSKACSKNGRTGKHICYWWESLKERVH
jgi:hypothetical protein